MHKDYVKSQGEDGHVQVKEGALRQIVPSWPLEGTHPTDALISDS